MPEEEWEQRKVRCIDCGQLVEGAKLFEHRTKECRPPMEPGILDRILKLMGVE